uniref:Lymphocyte antigen 6 family member M4 n=1 Tax=Cyprinus carpio TaxID=7962 RepID=A0A8C2JWX1_CYPCA
MDVQFSVFLLFIFFTAGHSLNCYECVGLSCANQNVKACPETNKCYSSTTVTQYGDTTTKAKIKGCLPSYACISGYTNFSIPNMSFFCCDTDLCNARDAPDPSVESSSTNSDIPNDVPNGKKCFYCDLQSCSKIRDCSGSEDQCFTATVNFGSQSVAAKGCISKQVCDASALLPSGQGITCCRGNLCNGVSVNQSVTQINIQSPDGAQSVTQSFLFLCCSLLSFILLH